MASDESLFIPAVDILPPSLHASLSEKVERVNVELLFKIPDSGPYEDSHQEMIEDATRGVKETINWNVTRTYGCFKGGMETENKLITVDFNARYEGLNELMNLVGIFKNDLTSLEREVDSKTKETEAHLIFWVPDEGKAYSAEEVDLIRQASLGHSWTVSRSYGTDEELKKIEFKIYFIYEVASERCQKFPGLKKFTTTLKNFLEKFNVSLGQIFHDSLSLTSESKYVIQKMPAPVRATLSQLSLDMQSRSSSDASIGNRKSTKFNDGSRMVSADGSNSSGTQSRPLSRDQELRGKSLFLEKLIELRRVERDKTPWVAEDILGFEITLKVTRDALMNDQ